MILFFNVCLKIGDPFSVFPIYKITSLLGGTQVIYWLQMTFMHHIIIEELRLGETSRGHLVQTACPNRATQNQLPRFGIFPRMETQPPPQETCASTWSSPAVSFLTVRGNSPLFQFVPIATGSVTGHHQKEPWLHNLCTFPSNVYIH